MVNGITANLFPSGSEMGVKTQRVQKNSDCVNTSDTWLEQYRENGVDLELNSSLQKLYQEQAEAARKNAEAAGEGFEDMGRALEIARRLMHGDRVPGSDEKFLMDYNRDLYMSAKNMQALAKNKDPKDYDSVLEEEEKQEAVERDSAGNLTIDASGLELCQEMPSKQK